MKIYYILHSENYRIGFVTPKSWVQNGKFMEYWFFSYHTFWPNIRTEISQLFIFGLGFGYKKQIR